MDNPNNQNPIVVRPSKPDRIQAISIMLLVSGIVNILVALGITIPLIAGTFGLGIFCAPLTLLPIVVAVFELMAAANLLANPTRPVTNLQMIAIFEICCIITGNVISMVIGIVNLMFYSDPETRNWLERPLI